MRPLLIAALFAAPLIASAATFSILTQRSDVDLYITATHPINTIEATVQLPVGVEPTFIQDGSVIADWIDPPLYDASTGVLTFSGIIPNGWEGQNARLLRIHLPQPGEVMIVAKGTHVYLNDGKGTEDISNVVVGSTARESTPLGPIALGFALVCLLSLVSYLVVRAREPYAPDFQQA